MVDKRFINKHLRAIKDCVKNASYEIMGIYQSDEFYHEEKLDGSPLTLADTKSNEAILSALKEISPEIPIISEETFNEKHLSSLSETYWLVDPLDGTKEFINKTDEFTVNIALINNKKAVFGIVAAPVSGRTWIGSVFDNNSYDEKNFNKNIRIVMSKSHKSENDKAFLQLLNNKGYMCEVLEKGSSLKLCSLADNDADIYPRFGPTSEWDIAAAHAVLSSYGGSIIKINDNKELNYAKESSILNPYFIAFRNNSLKNEFLPVLRDFFKKLV